MPLTGTFDTLSLQDLLQVVQQNQVSGVLTLSTGLEELRVALARGDVAALGSNTPARLDVGQALLAAGLLEAEPIRAALQAARQAGSLRAALLAHGAVRADDLARIEAGLAFEALLGLFFREEGSFHLSTGLSREAALAALPQQALLLEPPLRVQTLLLEALARQDEWQRLRELFPSVHTLLRAGPEALAAPWPAVRVLAGLGVATSLAELCLQMGQSRFEIYRQLLLGHEAGWVRVEAPEGDVHGLQAVEQALERARALLGERRFVEAQGALGVALELDPESDRTRELLEQVRRAELQHLRSRLPAAGVPSLAVPLDGLPGLPLDARELYLAAQLLGRLDVASLTLASALGELEVLRILEKLLDAGLVRI